MRFLRPVLLCVAPAGLPWLVPAAQETLLYDRSAIMQGQWWRLWTGHWLHFSVSHLAWNAIVLLAAGAWLEHLKPGALARYLLISAPLISLAFLVGEPAMHTYAGLSGLATGAVVLLALFQLARARAGRAWWGGLLVLVVLKIAFEATQAAPLFAGFGSQAVRTSALAHAAGAVTALVFFMSHQPAFSRVLSRRAAALGDPSR